MTPGVRKLFNFVFVFSVVSAVIFLITAVATPQSSSPVDSRLYGQWVLSKESKDGKEQPNNSTGKYAMLFSVDHVWAKTIYDGKEAVHGKMQYFVGGGKIEIRGQTLQGHQDLTGVYKINNNTLTIKGKLMADDHLFDIELVFKRK